MSFQQVLVMSSHPEKRSQAVWRNRLHEVILEADTPAGKAFEFVLLWSITISVAVVILESVAGIRHL